MSREVDTREHGVADVSAERQVQTIQQLREVSDRLPGDHRLDIMGWDQATGNPTTVRSTAAPAAAGDIVSRALAHATTISPILAGDGRALEFSAHPSVRTTSSGASVVHLQQQHLGIPVFHATLTARFDPDGAINDTVGSVHSFPEAWPSRPRSRLGRP